MSVNESIAASRALKERRSVVRSAFRAACWFGLFRSISQSLSWIATIIIARLLVPSDYGLMAMSTVITGYADMFKELGLGEAIIQRPGNTDRELSSIFWSTTVLGLFLGLLCFPIASLTGYVMKEPEVVPLTQSVSGLFVIGGLQIVPLSLLRKELSFKAVGRMEMMAMFTSGLVMIGCAAWGAGVWTFVFGFYTRAMVNLVYVYSLVRWRPAAYFSYTILKPFLKFGILTSLGSSISYVWHKSDRFFAGRVWPSQAVGYYTFALELSQIPTEKIVSLINQVSYPTFSKLQSDAEGFNRFYLQVIKTTALIVFPLFVGGYILGDQLTIVVLGDKWRPMASILSLLCLSQIPAALNAVNNSAHSAQGRPTWGLSFHLICLAAIPIAFYFSVDHGLNAMVLPWLGIHTLICLFWIFVTIRKIRIEARTYLRSLYHPFLGTAIMASLVLLSGRLLPSTDQPSVTILCCRIILGMLGYLCYFMIFDRSLLTGIRLLRSKT